MDYEALDAEINRLTEQIQKEDPTSDSYATLVKRLGELQAVSIKELTVKNEVSKSEEELALKRRELVTQEESIRQNAKNSKRETLVEYVKLFGSGAFTLAAILLTGHIEETDIIRTKAWSFIHNVFPRR